MTDKVARFTWRGRACGVNNKYLTRSYVLTKAYRDFRDGIALACRAANPGQRLEGEIGVSLVLTIDPARDSDSLLKPIFGASQQIVLVVVKVLRLRLLLWSGRLFGSGAGLVAHCQLSPVVPLALGVLAVAR